MKESRSIRIKKLICIITYLVVIFCMCYNILPLLIFGENYVFTVWDNLDSSMGIAEVIHSNNLYFNLNSDLPIMNGINGMYTTYTYNIYDFLKGTIGFFNAQIAIKILGTFIGFFGMQTLLKYIFNERDQIHTCIIYLVSMAYVITPCAPNRVLGFSYLPILVWLFLKLRNEIKISPLIIPVVVSPLFFNFTSFMIYVCAFWFLFTIVDFVFTRKLNKNLVVAFALLCLSTLFVNINYLKISIAASNTNRKIFVDSKNKANFSFYNLYKILKMGQGHAYDLHDEILLPFACVGSLYLLINKKEDVYVSKINTIMIIGWILWISSALIMELQECGFKSGFLLIDGFNWGRIIYFMRLMWYLMFIATLFVDKDSEILKIFALISILIQLVYVATTDVNYNDNRTTLVSKAFGYQDAETVTFKEFVEKDLLAKIKKDIDYKNDVVVAYGFHPSVLQYNGFNTLDGYLSVHPMEYQEKFRNVIEPALDVYDKYKDYYDNWGGRTYIYGELNYNPTRIKDIDPVSMYINVDEYKTLGGKYIISRAKVLNSDDLGIKLIKDYNSENSIYHFYVYVVN